MSDPTDDPLDRPVHIPRDPTKRHELYEFAGLTEAERLAIDQWCAEEQRAYEARLRRAMAGHGDDPMGFDVPHDSFGLNIVREEGG